MQCERRVEIPHVEQSETQLHRARPRGQRKIQRERNRRRLQHARGVFGREFETLGRPIRGGLGLRGLAIDQDARACNDVFRDGLGVFAKILERAEPQLFRAFIEHDLKQVGLVQLERDLETIRDDRRVNARERTRVRPRHRRGEREREQCHNRVKPPPNTALKLDSRHI